jgi:alpha-galactosidase
MRSTRWAGAGLVLGLLATGAVALQNGVARVPAMGWNSWNNFRCNINESIIREVADAIVSSGLRDAGYLYVNIGEPAGSAAC